MPRIVLITGAAGGIGRRLVNRFALLGDTVFAQDLSETGLDEVIAECSDLLGRVHKVVADITKAAALSEALNTAMATHGAVDVLIANAGGASSPTVRQT